MPLDFLFRRAEPRRAALKQLRELREPHLEPPRRVAAPAPKEEEAVAARTPQLPAGVRLMSPREMADWVHEMYLAGLIGWEDYQAAIPAELDPDYNITVGALTGEMAEPDRPRDMIREWEDRLEFVRRHCSFGDIGVKRAERIVSLLRGQAAHTMTRTGT